MAAGAYIGARAGIEGVKVGFAAARKFLVNP